MQDQHEVLEDWHRVPAEDVRYEYNDRNGPYAEGTLPIGRTVPRVIDICQALNKRSDQERSRRGPSLPREGRHPSREVGQQLLIFGRREFTDPVILEYSQYAP